jgi:hypothetical protein
MAEIASYSEVAVANMALLALGRGKFITSLTEDSQAARVIRHFLPYCRDAVLRAYPWNFAQRRASLPALETAPAFEYAYAYTLPNDCLWMHTVYGGDAEAWKIEGGQILTNISAPLPVKYTLRVTDLASADPLFVNALASRIASDCAVALTETVGKAEALWSIYMAKLREARAIDAQEGQPDQMQNGSWHDARYAGSFPPYSDWQG